MSYNHKSLNVKRLLEMGDLNMRETALQDPAPSAGDYFNKVEEFAKNGQKYIDTLENLSKLAENIKSLKEFEKKLGITERSVELSGDTEAIQAIENLKTLLTEIGYDSLNDDMDSIANALKTGDVKAAETMSGKALPLLSKLYNNVKSAYSPKKSTGEPSKSPQAAPAEDISLAKVLEILDSEEENRKLRILAVDDVSVVLNTITSALSPYYEVYALKNGAQVEKFLTHTTPELFLLDIEMKGVSGFDLVPIIRRSEKHRDTPIIFLTGNASLDNLKDAIALGACDFITKPVNWEVLLEKIQKQIIRKKSY